MAGALLTGNKTASREVRGDDLAGHRAEEMAGPDRWFKNRPALESHCLDGLPHRPRQVREAVMSVEHRI